MVAQAALISTEWQWQELQILGERGTTTTVPNPENYTLRFSEDGTFSLQADCNRGAGSYTLDGLEINLQLGPMTLAACAPDSLSDQYISRLSAVSSFSADDSGLSLVGTVGDEVYLMRFAP